MTGRIARHARVAAWLVGTVAACSRTPASGAPDAAASASASGAAVPVAGDSVEPGSSELKPVYPLDAGAPDPQAMRFCEAVFATAEVRKAACCGGAAGVGGTAVSAQCTRTLTAALGAHAVTLAPADVDRCVDAVARATAGCDWVTIGSPPVPPACDGIIHGALAAKARCRSSLECPDGLRCQGLSTIDVGVCAPPKPAGALCNTANEMLASFTRQDSLDKSHPECAGYCAHSQCRPAVAAGAACKSDFECGRGRCEGGRCTAAPLPQVGEACASACAYGSRCFRGRCTAPRAEGESCDASEQCRGACVAAEAGAAGGICAMACSVPHVPSPRGSR